MNYRQIIAESWAYTQGNKKLIRWLGFFPALFTTTVATFTLLYQLFSFKSSYLFSREDGNFLHEVISFASTFVKSHLTLTLPLIVFIIIFGLIYLLFPTLAEAAAIQVIARDKNGQKASIAAGVKYGASAYLPLVEYHAMMKAFSFMFILIEMAFAVRYSMNLFLFLMPIFLLFLAVGLVLTLLFTYAGFYIVIDEENVFSSIRKSTHLVIMHWKHTFLITVLMMIIGIRIVLQVVLVFLIPVLIVVFTGYLSLVVAPGISVIVGGVIGLAGLVVAAYINGVVDIFSYTVWTCTFLKLTSEQEVSAREVFVDDIGGNAKAQVESGSEG